MSQFSHWLCAMQEHIIADVTSVPSLPQIQTIRFVRCFDGPDATALWIGEGSDILSLLDRREDLAGLAFFAAGDAAGLAGRAQERKVDLAVACLDLLELYDRLSAILRRRQAWAVRLLEAAGRQHNIQDIVDTAAELACGSLFLLNAGRKVVHFSGHTCLDSPPAQEILELGLLTASTMQSLTDDGPAGPASSLFCHAMGSRGKCWVQHVRKRGELISYMVLFTPFFWRDADACMLLGAVRDTISWVTASQADGYWAGSDFRTVLMELLTGKLTGEEEICRRFSLISRIPQQFCSFIIVEPGSPDGFSDTPSALLARLEAIFPESNAALYDGGIVLLLSRPDRDFQPAPVFDRAHLQDLLIRYDSYAAISNATSRRSMLRTNYLLTKSVLQLGRVLRPSTRDRIFFFEEYAEYVSIDLCLNSFNALMGHDDIIYLTHPEAVKLYRYDVAHNTNLLDVLYYYCLNNCSVSQAARAAYMHRNTFSARLAKLQELIKADLANGEIQQRMVFSYKILRYYDHYAKIDLNKRLNAGRLHHEQTGVSP